MVVHRSSNLSRDIVLGLARSQEIAGNDLSSLMDQLIKSVLAVGSRLSPNDGTGLVIHLETLVINVLAVGLHVSLLEVGGEAVHVLIIGKNGD